MIDHGVIAHFGVSGSGKTHAMKGSVYEAVAGGTTVVVCDRQREWGDVPEPIANVTCEVKALGQAVGAANEGARLIIVPGAPSLEGLDALASWVVARGKRPPGSGEERGIAVPEAHRVLDPHVKIPKQLDEIVSAWRHYGANLWVDSQRISRLTRHITEQAAIARIFASVGDRDLKVCQDLGGNDLMMAVQACAARLGRSGKVPPPPEDSGWHVELRYARTGPYHAMRVTDGRPEYLKMKQTTLALES